MNTQPLSKLKKIHSKISLFIRRGLPTSHFVCRDKNNFNTTTTEIKNEIPNTNILLQSLIWNKIPNPNYLIKKTDFDAKSTEIRNKIPSATNLVKETDFRGKIAEIIEVPR